MDFYVTKNFYCLNSKIQLDDLVYYPSAVFDYFRENKKHDLFNWRESYTSELDKFDHFFYEYFFDVYNRIVYEMLHDDLEKFTKEKINYRIHFRSPDFYQVNINVTEFPKDSISNSELLQVFDYNLNDQVTYNKRSYFFKYLSDAKAFSEKCKSFIDSIDGNNSKIVQPIFMLTDTEIDGINSIVNKKKAEREEFLKKYL